MQNHQNNTQNLSAEARSKGGRHSPGGFKDDRARAEEPGKKGGQHAQAARRDEKNEE